MAWRRPGDKSLDEPMMIKLMTHICVTRPQWVKDFEAIVNFILLVVVIIISIVVVVDIIIINIIYIRIYETLWSINMALNDQLRHIGAMQFTFTSIGIFGISQRGNWMKSPE